MFISVKKIGVKFLTILTPRRNKMPKKWEEADNEEPGKDVEDDDDDMWEDEEES
jgi:hypothetical protein